MVVISADPICLRFEMYSPACWFDERVGVTDAHRDTIVYPATLKATGRIVSIPNAAFNIVRSFPCLLTATGCGLKVGRRFA